MQTILVLALDGVMDSSLAITLDTLRVAQSIAERTDSPARLRVIVAGHKANLTTGGGMRLTTDTTFKKAMAGKTRPDWIIVPGLGWNSEAEIVSRFAGRDAREAVELL